MKASPLFLVFLAALLWSTGGLFIKATDLNAYEISFGRSLIAAVTVALFIRGEGFRINRVGVIAAVLYAATLLLFVTATKLTTAANAIFLQYTAPVYMLLFEPVFSREKRRASDFITVAVCLAGMCLFFVGKLRSQDVTGNLAALASGFCFAFFALLLRHPGAGGTAGRAAPIVWGNVLLAVVTVPAFFVPAAQTPTLRDALILLYLGIFQLGLAYVLFSRGLARGVRSLDAGILGYIEPVLNPIWVYLFLGERPSAWALVGGGIILLAVAAHGLRGARLGGKGSGPETANPSSVSGDGAEERTSKK